MSDYCHTYYMSQKKVIDFLKSQGYTIINTRNILKRLGYDKKSIDKKLDCSKFFLDSKYAYKNSSEERDLYCKFESYINNRENSILNNIVTCNSIYDAAFDYYIYIVVDKILDKIMNEITKVDGKESNNILP